MSIDPDEEALSWAGDDALDLQGSAPSSKDAAVSVAPTEALAPATSSFLLVTYGLLGGIYLLYAFGWVITIMRNTVTIPNLLGEIMFQFGEFLAIGSGALWFLAVFWLTRGRRSIVRLLWLLLGLVVLVPWPFVLGV